MSQDPTPPFDHELERGLANRRAAMSDAFVDRAFAHATSFNAEFQNFMTRYAWQGVWGRPGLDWSSRRLIVLAITSALGRWEEFDGHLRGALTPGNEGALTVDQLREALIQFAIYAGVPAANTAMVRATGILRELGYEVTPQPADQAAHPGTGRSVFTTSRPRQHASVRTPRRGAPRATFFFSHALGQDHSMWDGVADELAEHHTLVCADTRGHGRSDLSGGAFTLADLADDAARLLDELEARGLCSGPVVWVGLSMGGMVGQEFALRHAARLRALVLANTTGQYPATGRQAMNERLAAARDRGLDAIAEGTMSRFFTQDFRAGRGAATVARARRLFEATDPQAYLACGSAVREVDTLSRLHEIEVPALVISGAHDEGTPPAMAQALHAGIAGSKLATLEAAHLSAVEQPRAFAQELLRFVGGL